MKISVVMAYYNRKELLHRTLKSIAKTKHSDYEVIVVDDASGDNHRVESFLTEFPFLKIVRIEKKDKWYYNSCIPFNKGFESVTGDVVVIQNPECLHVHDVLSYVAKEINDSNYITMSAYSIDEVLTNSIPDILKKGELLGFFSSLPQQSVLDHVGWYNHSIYRSVYYHFCAAITKKNLNIIGGFDNRYAGGAGWDDVDFVYEIDKLGLRKIINDEVSVIHQWHHPVYGVGGGDGKRYYNNERILNEKWR